MKFYLRLAYLLGIIGLVQAEEPDYMKNNFRMGDSSINQDFSTSGQRVYLKNTPYLELKAIHDSFLYTLENKPWESVLPELLCNGYSLCPSYTHKITGPGEKNNIKILKNQNMQHVYFFVYLDEYGVFINHKIVVFSMNHRKGNLNYILLQHLAYPNENSFCISLIHELREIELQCLAILSKNMEWYKKTFQLREMYLSLQLLYILKHKGDVEAASLLEERERKYNINAIEAIHQKLKFSKNLHINLKPGISFQYMPNLLFQYWNKQIKKEP